MICLIWERPGLVGRLPDTVWTCCGGLLIIVFRLISMAVWLQSATLKMKNLAFISFIIGTDCFLTVTCHTMRWATCTVLIHCLIMWLSITLDIQTTATKIESLLPLTQGGEDLWMFMWHNTQIRWTLTRITPTALALIFWRTFKTRAVKTSSEDARILLNIYPWTYLSQCNTTRHTPVRERIAAGRCCAAVCWSWCSLLLLLSIYCWKWKYSFIAILANFETACCCLFSLSQKLNTLTCLLLCWIICNVEHCIFITAFLLILLHNFCFHIFLCLFFEIYRDWIALELKLQKQLTCICAI